MAAINAALMTIDFFFTFAYANIMSLYIYSLTHLQTEIVLFNMFYAIWVHFDIQDGVQDVYSLSSMWMVGWKGLMSCIFALVNA